MSELVHIRLEPKIRKDIKEIVSTNSFSSESEFIHDSIRKNVEMYKKLQLLTQFRNTLSTKKTKGIPSDVFGEFGIK